MKTALDPFVIWLLRHADDNLILAQRLAEWSAQAPDIEEDIALTNIGLDHLGQARALLAHAGRVEGTGRDEDRLAFFRTDRDFYNLILVEQPNGDFAHTIARQFFFDAYQVPFWTGLEISTEPTVAGIAGKAVKEARYHLRHSSAWVVRLGDGTTESHQRMQDAVDGLWRFTGELFAGDSVDDDVRATGLGIDVESLRSVWLATAERVFAEASLSIPDDSFQVTGGRRGVHSEHLGYVLAEMQWMQRTYPGLEW